MNDIEQPFDKFMDMIADMDDEQYEQLSNQLYAEVHQTPEGQFVAIHQDDSPEMKIFKEYHNSSQHQHNILSSEIKSVVGSVPDEEISQLTSAFEKTQKNNPNLSFSSTISKIKHMRETNDPELKTSHSFTPK